MLNTTLGYIEHEGKYLMLHRIKKKNDINKGEDHGLQNRHKRGIINTGARRNGTRLYKT